MAKHTKTLRLLEDCRFAASAVNVSERTVRTARDGQRPAPIGAGAVTQPEHTAIAGTSDGGRSKMPQLKHFSANQHASIEAPSQSEAACPGKISVTEKTGKSAALTQPQIRQLAEYLSHKRQTSETVETPAITGVSQEDLSAIAGMLTQTTSRRHCNEH